MLVPPDFDTGTVEEWFCYFRISPYMPAMPYQFKQAFDEAPDAGCARRIITGYIASACDIALMYNTDKAVEDDFLPVMRDQFNIPPEDFLHLNARTIAALAELDVARFCVALEKLGFTLAPDGLVTGYAPPPPANPAAPPRPPAPKGP